MIFHFIALGWLVSLSDAPSMSLDVSWKVNLLISLEGVNRGTPR